MPIVTGGCPLVFQVIDLFAEFMNLVGQFFVRLIIFQPLVGIIGLFLGFGLGILGIGLVLLFLRHSQFKRRLIRVLRVAGIALSLRLVGFRRLLIFTGVDVVFQGGIQLGELGGERLSLAVEFQAL